MIVSKEDILKKNISYCKKCMDTTTYTMTVENALHEIRDGVYQSEIASLRASSNEEKRDKKSKLKGYVFGGEFFVRNQKNLVNYSYLCVLDFDHIQCANIEDAKEEIFQNKYVFAAWISPSGDGIKAIIHFDFSAFECDEHTDYASLHKQAYKQFSEKINFKYKLDKTGCNVDRLCFTSSDPQIKYKDSVELFPVEKEEIVVSRAISYNDQDKSIANSSQSVHINVSESDVMHIQRPTNNEYRHCMKSIYRFLKNRSLSITSTYNEWYRVGQAIANIFSYSIGKEYYLKLCRLDDKKHDEEKSIKKIIECYSQSKNNTANDKKLGLKMIIDAAKQKGWKIEGRRC